MLLPPPQAALLLLLPPPRAALYLLLPPPRAALYLLLPPPQAAPSSPSHSLPFLPVRRPLLPLPLSAKRPSPLPPAPPRGVPSQPAQHPFASASPPARASSPLPCASSAPPCGLPPPLALASPPLALASPHLWLSSLQLAHFLSSLVPSVSPAPHWPPLRRAQPPPLMLPPAAAVHGGRCDSPPTHPPSAQVQPCNAAVWCCSQPQASSAGSWTSICVPTAHGRVSHLYRVSHLRRHRGRRRRLHPRESRLPVPPAATLEASAPGVAAPTPLDSPC